MRFATYNVEWFTALFDDDNNLVEDDEPSARPEATRAEQVQALGRVFKTIDADAVLVIEAPDTNRKRSTEAALSSFSRRFDLRLKEAVIGFPNETQQEIALMYDPARLVVRHDPKGNPTGKKGAEDAPRFDGVFRIDLDIDDRDDLVRWSKPPLELEILTARGTLFRLIGVHAKSKAPHGAETPEAVMRLSITNRRKQLAQCIWLRQRIEHYLAAGESVIVAGDFNDGPGLDEYEKLFGRSGLGIVMGDEDDDRRRLFDPHARAALRPRPGALPTTARFWVETEERWLSALLDYILISQDLRGKNPRWRIWHPFEDPECYSNAGLRAALLMASDHFPVTLDIDI